MSRTYNSPFYISFSRHHILRYSSLKSKPQDGFRLFGLNTSVLACYRSVIPFVSLLTCYHLASSPLSPSSTLLANKVAVLGLIVTVAIKIAQIYRNSCAKRAQLTTRVLTLKFSFLFLPGFFFIFHFSVK